jgi:hypothetical protein
VLKECIEDLPRGVRLWVETYGERVLLAGTPGNKLYLLLRKQLQNGGSGNAEVRRLAFPIHLPARITRGERGTGFSRRMSRVRIEVGYTLSRLSFHVIEGMKFALESARWQRLLGETLR